MANVINLVVRASNQTAAGLRNAHRAINRFNQRAERSIRDGWRNIARTASGALSDGLANGLGNGLRTAMSNPFVAIGVGILATTLAGLLAAALSAALILAIGGAFVGLGVVLAMEADGVKEKWASTLGELKPLFADAATPMLPVIENARKQLERVAKEFAPHFKDALAGSAPHVQTFFDHIVKGFERLGEKAAVPLEEAFNTLLAALGPMLEDTLAGMGDSLAALARTVTEHSTEIATAFNMIIGLITTAIDILNFFANAWAFLWRAAHSAMGNILGLVGGMVDMMLGAFEIVLKAAQKGFSWIPGLGDQLDTAVSDFGQFRDATKHSMDILAEKFKNTGKELDRANRKRKLEVDIASFQNRIATAKRDLKSVPPKKRAAVLANIADLQAKVRAAKAALAQLRNKTVYVSVNVADNSLNRTRNVNGRYVRASGGITGAATGGIRNSMTMVGEQGPELLDLPAGSRIRSNPDSRRIMRGGGGGGAGVLYATFEIGGREVGSAIIDIARKEIANRGGNVQATLGQKGR